jgi:hypothetical protein
VLIATRFLMPAVLMLHIGLATLLLVVARRWNGYSERRRLTLFGTISAVLAIFVTCSWVGFSREANLARQDGSDYDYALALTRDIPDMEPIAVCDVAVWPVVAAGQGAIGAVAGARHSGPRPAAGRDREIIRSDAQPRAADRTRQTLGVRTLIMHRKGALRRQMPPHLITTLQRQSLRQERAGPFVRFDLY